MIIFLNIGKNEKIYPNMLWLEIYKSQVGSEGEMDLFIYGSHGYKNKNYNIWYLQSNGTTRKVWIRCYYNVGIGL